MFVAVGPAGVVAVLVVLEVGLVVGVVRVVADVVGVEVSSVVVSATVEGSG